MHFQLLILSLAFAAVASAADMKEYTPGPQVQADFKPFLQECGLSATSVDTLANFLASFFKALEDPTATTGYSGFFTADAQQTGDIQESCVGPEQILQCKNDRLSDGRQQVVSMHAPGKKTPMC